MHYEARELAELAEAGWQFLQERKSGVPKIRFESRPGPMGAERVRSVSIIEMINDDMPFLLDSVMAELAQQSVDVRLVLHPIFTVERDQTGALIGFRGDGPAVGAARRESFISIHVERIEDEARQSQIIEAIRGVLADVRLCVQDWRPMMSRVGEVIAEIKNNPPPLPVEEIAEATQFLEWLVANNFTFLGVREYALTGDERGYEVVPESGLGILRSPDVHVLRRGSELVSLTPEIMEFLKEPKQLIITKANVKSRVHRRVHMDYIGVKRFDLDGNLVGEFRIVGLFTSTVYTRSTRSIPYLRRKVDNLMRRSGFDPDSHSGKAFAAVLEHYSRDELFQIDEDTLFQFVLAIMHLDERPRVRVLARRDRFDRFVSVMVFVPRERYDSAARAAIGTYLAGVYKGRVSAFFPSFTEGPLVRVHFIIARLGGETPSPDRPTLEQPGRGAGAHLDRRARRSAHDGARADQGAAADPPLSRRVPDRLSRSLCAGDHGRRYPADRKPLADPPARRRLLQPPRGRSRRRGTQGLEPREADRAVRARARAGEHGLQGGRRAHLSDRAGRRRSRRGVAPRHAAGARRRRGLRHRSAEGAPRSRLHGGDARARRERRLQRAGAQPLGCNGATLR